MKKEPQNVNEKETEKTNNEKENTVDVKEISKPKKQEDKKENINSKKDLNSNKKENVEKKSDFIFLPSV